MMLLLCAAVLPAPRTAQAGRFTWEAGCDTLSKDPLRLRLRFWIWDTAHYFGDFCQVRIEPVAVPSLGWELHPVLAAEAPSFLTVTVDGLAGTATYTATPCMGSYSILDSLALIVDGGPAAFIASLISQGAYAGHTDIMYFHCDPDVATPTRRGSWGRLKIRYR